MVVAPVSGAPGDGTRSLTTALKKRLYAGGVKLANGTTANVYMVKGTVSLADASGGKQSIRIDWQVLDPSGKKLGTVSQQNTIPQGVAERALGRHRRCRRRRRRRRHHQAPAQVELSLIHSLSACLRFTAPVTAC